MAVKNSVEFSIGLIVMTIFFLVFDFFPFKCKKEGIFFPIQEFIIASIIFILANIAIITSLNFLFTKKPARIVLFYSFKWIAIFIIFAFIVLLIKCSFKQQKEK